MGLISNLCVEMDVAPEQLARIVGISVERVAQWAVGGVPPHHHSDFRPLEELVEIVRGWSSAPVRTSIRVAVPALGGGSVLEALEEQGAVFALDRLRVDVRVEPHGARSVA